VFSRGPAKGWRTRSWKAVCSAGGEKVDLAGESVFVGVEPGALLAGLGFGRGRAGGFFGKLGVVSRDDVRCCRDARKERPYEAEVKGQLYLWSDRVPGQSQNACRRQGSAVSPGVGARVNGRNDGQSQTRGILD
jgi:hypothetical protein